MPIVMAMALAGCVFPYLRGNMDNPTLHSPSAQVHFRRAAEINELVNISSNQNIRVDSIPFRSCHIEITVSRFLASNVFSDFHCVQWRNSFISDSVTVPVPELLSEIEKTAILHFRLARDITCLAILSLSPSLSVCLSMSLSHSLTLSLWFSCRYMET